MLGFNNSFIYGFDFPYSLNLGWIQNYIYIDREENRRYRIGSTMIG